MTKVVQVCQECKKAYEHEHNPEFPRKYCPPCSAAKKESFKDRGKQSMPTQQAPKQEFHLSPEQVRTNALNAVIETRMTYSEDEFWKAVEKFELYISGDKEKFDK